MLNAQRRRIALKLNAGLYFLIFGFHTNAQFVDPFGDAGTGSCYLREEKGQTRRADGTSVTDCKYYYERTPMGIYLRTKSKVSFVLAALHSDSVTNDTVYNIGMALGNREISPTASASLVGGLANYYLGGFTAEGVPAHDYVDYKEIADSTDVRFYYGSTGPRMAIVMRPGADPSEVKLSFAGQDSIGIDWQGHLKLYIANKWVELNEAIAYQVDDNDEIIPVNWQPNYVVEPGNVTVGFTYETFNPAWPLIFLAGYPPMPPPVGNNVGNLGWSTYTASPYADEMTAVEVDAAGNPYTCGYFSHLFYPLNQGITVYPPGPVSLAESRCGVVMRFNKDTKMIQWGTYIGGWADGETRAHKLALYTGVQQNLKYAYVTGSTNSDDFESSARPDFAFEDAYVEDHVGGISRMWLAACRMESGVLDWATTHGQPGPDRTWSTHGLAVTISRQGQLTVAGMIDKGYNNVEPEFPLVTPNGAFSRALGDGFLISFKPDFTIDWSTALLEFSGNSRIGRINDLRSTTTDGDQYGVWAVGASVYGTSEPLDLVPPPSGGYFQSVAGGVSAVIMQIDLNNHQIVYCTRWGSPGTGASSSALAVHETDDFVYVAGFSQAFDLTATECPSPGSGTQVFYTTTNATTGDQASDGFVLRFKRLSGYQLDYGSLLGGDRDDIVLDVNSDGAGRIYLTGESRSSYGLTIAIPTDYYTQPHLTLVNRRDAFIYGIQDEEWPAIFWATAFGGTQSERGWGIAASPDEVYLCGATSTGYTQQFPLMEWNTDPNDPESLLDWFWEANPAGLAYELVPWMTFFQAMDYETFGIDVFIEGLNSWHDGYIASFNMAADVAVPEGLVPAPPSLIAAWPTADGEGYIVQLPQDGPWQLELYDARGRLVERTAAAKRIHYLPLSQTAPGMYVLRASLNGSAHTIKLARP
ncbi:MAG: T9SS type A sorting domain-containing protein [Flavobacteriales bacterium]|nr:T9SS type A sorting domain-containing protein [Flavobacteriales bacterium]